MATNLLVRVQRHLTHIESVDTQGGDMVNCLAVWDNLLVSGGDGGQLLVRSLYCCNIVPETIATSPSGCG